MPLPSTLPLNDGHALPQLGMGLYGVTGEAVARVVDAGLASGYRALDTAAFYGNEAEVGAAVRAAPLPRDAVFVTTKLWNDDHHRAQDALRASLARLGLAHVDLYLIHWPRPRAGRYVQAWRSLIGLRAEGLTRSIGVSNFTQAHLRRLMDETGVVPAVNQVELHPRFQQRALRDFHAEHGIATQCWSPLGRGRALEHPAIAGIAARLGRSPAQVVIRWHLQSGLAPIPKSADPARLRANAAVSDFALGTDDMDAIAALDDPGGRNGADPDHSG